MDYLERIDGLSIWSAEMEKPEENQRLSTEMAKELVNMIADVEREEAEVQDAASGDDSQARTTSEESKESDAA